MLFFRESCFKPSGDKKRGNNPTHYRYSIYTCGSVLMNKKTLVVIQHLVAQCFPQLVQLVISSQLKGAPNPKDKQALSVMHAGLGLEAC